MWERLVKYSLVRKFVHAVVGAVFYPRLAIFNKLTFEGTEHFKHLPKKNVLFVSNHQTYFVDVITFLSIFSAAKWGKKNRLGIPFYLLNPFTNVRYIAAAQTMKDSWVARFFRLAGGVVVKRTWNDKSNEVRKGLDPSDTRKIARALEQNWVITFPQGTTTPYAPGRKGTAVIIRYTQPVVIPVVIEGFSTAFDKTGLKTKKRGTTLKVTFKAPLDIDYKMPADKIMEQIMEAIEQSSAYAAKQGAATSAVTQTIE